MKKILLLVLLLVIFMQSAYSVTIRELADSNEWHDLLLDDPYGAGFITDDSKFFACGERDYQKEIDYLLENRGPELYARFPARYECISRNLGIDIPYLEGNEELNAYLQEYDFDAISVGFAEPCNSQAMSFFGHAFMLLWNRGRPINEGLALNLFGYVDEFSGTETIVRGLQGRIDGYFDFDSVANIFENYTINLDRMVIEYKLKLDPDAVRRILLMVWDLRGAPISYQFVTRNCVNGTMALLDYAVGNVDIRSEFPGVLLPSSLIDVITQFNLKESENVYSPVVTQMGTEVSPERIPEFDQRKTAWTTDGWSNGKGNGLPPFIPKLDEVRRPLYFDTNSPYIELGGSARLFGNGKYRIELEGRYLLADEWERVFSAKKPLQLTLGRMKLFYSDNKNWGLDRLDLWETAEYPKLMQYHNHLSKKLYLGAHRDFADGNLKPVITIGRGLSVGAEGLLLYAMAEADAVFDWIGINTGGEAGLMLNGSWGMMKLTGYYPFWAYPEHSKRKPAAEVSARFRICPEFILGADYDILENRLRISTRFNFAM